MSQSEGADVRVKLDSGQVREIVAAKRQSFELEGELKRFKPEVQRAARSIADQTLRAEAFARKVIDGATKLVDIAKRAEQFFQFGESIEAGRGAQARTAANVLQGALRGAQALSFIPVAGPIAGALAGAKFGAEVETRRREGDQRVYEVNRGEEIALKEFNRLNNESGRARQLADRAAQRSSAALRRAFRRVTR